MSDDAAPGTRAATNHHGAHGRGLAALAALVCWMAGAAGCLTTVGGARAPDGSGLEQDAVADAGPGPADGGASDVAASEGAGGDRAVGDVAVGEGAGGDGAVGDGGADAAAMDAGPLDGGGALDSAAPPPTGQSTKPYNGAYLGVLQTGSQGNHTIKGLNATGFRFRARHTGQLLSVAVHIKAVTYLNKSTCTPTSCYGGGNGGNVQAALYADDGKGAPDLSKPLGATNKVLAVIKTWGEPDEVRTFTFAKPVNLTVDKRYDVLFSNDASSQGWSSVNWQYCLINPLFAGEPISPYWSDELVWKYGAADKRAQPAFRLSLKVGGSTIQWGSVNIMARGGVIDDSALYDSVRSICGAKRIRQRLIPPSNLTAKQVLVPLALYGSGTGKLLVRITDATGAPLGPSAQATFSPAQAVNIGSTYKNIYTGTSLVGQNVFLRYRAAALAAPVSLLAGKVYYLEASSPSSGPCYVLMANESSFRDGHDTVASREAWNEQAEYADGTSWKLMYIWGKPRKTMEWPIALGLQ